MSLGLSANFGYQASQGIEAFAAPAQPSGASIMNVVAPNLNISSAMTDLTQTVGAGAASQARAGVAASAQMGQQTLGAGADALMQVKAQITAVANAALGPGGAEAAFPDTKMAPDSVAELGLGIATGKMSNLMGKGTAAQLATGALEGSSALSGAADIQAGLKGRPTEEIEAAVRDACVANSPQNWQPPSNAMIQDADQTVRLDQPLSFDVEALLAADDGAMAKIMAFDGTDFRNFPELHDLQCNIAAAELRVGELTQMEGYVVESAAQIEAMDLSSVTAQAAILDATSLDMADTNRWGVAGPLAAMFENVYPSGPAVNAVPGSAQDREAEVVEMAHRIEQPAARMGMMG